LTKLKTPGGSITKADLGQPGHYGRNRVVRFSEGTCVVSPPESTAEWLTLKEAAELIGCKVGTVRDLVAAGEIEKRRQRPSVDRASVAKWLEDHLDPDGTPPRALVPRRRGSRTPRRHQGLGDTGPTAHEVLVDQICEELRAHGRARVEPADLTVSTGQWRHAARAAARRIGYSVKTGREGGGPDYASRLPGAPEGGWAVWARLGEPLEPSPSPAAD
jgi:excisionase family DNA binding protein